MPVCAVVEKFYYVRTLVQTHLKSNVSTVVVAFFIMECVQPFHHEHAIGSRTLYHVVQPIRARIIVPEGQIVPEGIYGL